MSKNNQIPTSFSFTVTALQFNREIKENKKGNNSTKRNFSKKNHKTPFRLVTCSPALWLNVEVKGLQKKLILLER